MKPTEHVTFSFLFLPGMRSIERDGAAVAVPHPADIVR